MKKLTLTLLILLFVFGAFASATFVQQEPLPNDTDEVAKAHALQKKVVDEGRFVKSVDEALAVTLPQGVKKKIGNQELILVIESMTYTPQGAKVTAYMICDIPRSEQKMALKGKDLSFCPGGFTGNARLELMQDVNVPLGKGMTMVIKGGAESSKTYVECDCKGYKSMGLKGEIQFSDSMLTPVDANGNELKNTKVKAPFETQLVGWDDLLIEVGISPFKVKKIKDFSFAVNSAVFDFSEAANSPVMKFPEGYESSDFTDGDQKMWKGFFLKDLIVTYSGMNDSLKNEDGKQTIKAPTIEAHSLIIDKMGVSGKFMGKNLIPLEKGSIAGWPFALDELSAEITKNQFASCGLKGRITVPPLGDTTTLAFDAFIDAENNYSFIVKNQDTLNMDIFAASLRLDPNSTIDISKIEGKFKAKAILNGELDLKAKETEIAGIAFEQLELTPEAPYMKVKAFSFGKPGKDQKLGKFPINISNIGMVTENERTGLKFDLKLNLVGEKSGGFAGETGLTVFAKNITENNRQRWKYDGLEVSKIAIDIDGGAYKLKGSAEWYKKDTVYGNGFTGNLEAEFKSLPKIEASALFGNINGMRYWYADALISLNKGIPMFGGVKLYGFGGGAYHHMRQLAWNEKLNTTIGKTPSGIIYKPDETTKVGFKATVNLGLESKSLFNSDLTFEMAFNNNNGVDRILFKGNGYFMTPIDKSGPGLEGLQAKCKEISNGKDPNLMDSKDKDPGRSSLYAFVNLDFDFRNDVIHGNLGTYVNLSNGVLQGTGPGGKAGEAVMHFAKDEWYIYIGTPSNRIGVKALNFAELNAYFMVGTKIPESPPPPAKVSEILGGIDLDYMSSLNALGDGKGIAFGAGLQFNTGHKKFFPFYATFDAGAGFDVMLKNYGTVKCLGRSEPLGINGWYANGQVWAYLEGSIGIEIDWRFLKGKYEILKVGAAAVLQAKLPNPFWMRGIVGGRYSILGGLVSGSCRFDFTIGEECEIVSGGSPVQAMQVISEVTPNDGSTDVNVFNAPQAVFSMPMQKVFELQDIEGNNIAFKIELDHFKLYDGKQEIRGDMEWNAEKDVLVFHSFEILPPEKKITAEVQVSFKEYTNGSWKVVMDNGTKVIEKVSTTFTTGQAPPYIDPNNVTYSYPMPKMYNYYKSESEIGYIQLTTGQGYLFTPGAKWKQIGRFADKQGNKHEFEFRYIDAERKVIFNRPANLKNNTVYKFELVNIPNQANAAIDNNVVENIKKTNVAEGNESTIEIKSKDAEGTLDVLEEKNIYESYFRTSIYNTFTEKINHLNMQDGYQWPIRTLVHRLSKGIEGGERFDLYEVEGNNKISPIVQFENILDNNTWYLPYIYPYLYKNYPLDNNTITITNRSAEPVGIPPLRTIYIGMDKPITNLSESDILYGSLDTDIGDAGIHSLLVDYVEKDYYNLVYEVCKKYQTGTTNSDLSHLLETPFTPVKRGNYNFKIYYVLPGINTITSTTNSTIKINY